MVSLCQILRLSDGETSGYYDDYDQDEQKVNAKEQHLAKLIRQNFEILVPNIIALKPMYDKAVKEEDERRCLGLTRLFVDTAEQYCDWIIQSVLYSLSFFLSLSLSVFVWCHSVIGTSLLWLYQ